VAASVYQATTARIWPPLDAAIAKLRQYVAIELVLPVDHPQCLDVALHANRAGRSLLFRYLKWKDQVATDREVLPYRVYSNWGHWYVHGPEVDDTEVKQFRIDRMTNARVGDVEFIPPSDVALPDWLDLSAYERTVTVSVPRSVLEALPRPHTLDDIVDEGGDRVRATVRVAGERQLDHLLVSLGPDGKVVEPSEYEARRREHAARLLALYS
jgi:predicted DNA-binding transcriptional regulator YafY